MFSHANKLLLRFLHAKFIYKLYIRDSRIVPNNMLSFLTNHYLYYCFIKTLFRFIRVSIRIVERILRPFDNVYISQLVFVELWS
jgi:hypothetical protein